MTQRDWLRRLLEDEPSREFETAAADGATREFRLANGPPLEGSLTVAVDGAATTAYTQPEPDTVRFIATPAADAQVTFRYSQQTFSDAELDHYLGEAERDWGTAGGAQVYRAAMYAVDALLAGGATAINFGSGNESFDMASVFDRLLRLRSSFAAALAGEASRPALLTRG